MNEAMKVENLKRFFGDINKPITTNYVSAYEDPSATSFLILGSLGGVDVKNYIVAFYPDEIVLAPLTLSGDFQGKYITVNKDQIQDISVKKGLMQYKVTLTVDGQKFKLKCTKFTMTSPWQKENVNFLASKDWYIASLNS